ncbi:unnamed protein product [Vitrella brassicaformis CCMP3155]|uniref:Uncharacterized protein n=2 Tax=Vitrella brassicaformis TaxID=1169539 RepID=A0A0G4FFE6_VITBC|nr:unnamed protein product [Vitrella brassicaformis CCMP3155]|eukprot:CEM11905.1 unnamed protein product [Vitrella brassicaformis CCMP3155]
MAPVAEAPPEAARRQITAVCKCSQWRRLTATIFAILAHLLLLPPAAHCFQPPLLRWPAPHSRHASSPASFDPPSAPRRRLAADGRRLGVLDAAKDFKGFGDKPPKPVKKGKKDNDLDPEAQKYAKAYDELAAKGIPEYAVWARPKGLPDEAWVPVGSMAVPRKMKIDDVIYKEEEQMKKGLFKLYPKLKESPEGGEAEFEYGYNLRAYPDEPVKVAKKPQGGEKNEFVQWFESLMNPLDASKAKGGDAAINIGKN